jgi:hypothetical protein
MEQVLEQVFFNVPLVKLEPIFKRWVMEAISETKPKEPVKQQVYDRNEIKEKFHVSYPTLNRWNKEGILEVTKVGGRVLYTLESIEKALNVGQPIKYRRVNNGR